MEENLIRKRSVSTKNIGGSFHISYDDTNDDTEDVFKLVC